MRVRRTSASGGAGLIGGHLCDRLLDRGKQVRCVDNLRLGRCRNFPHPAMFPAFHFVDRDVLDRSALSAPFKEARVDAMFHLTANSGIAAGNGDVPPDISRLQAIGWRLQRHSTEAIGCAVDRILANGF